MSVGTERDDRLVIYGCFALSLAVVITVFRPWDLHDRFMVELPFGRDFVNFWLAGRLALQGPLDLLVDIQAWNDLIADEFAHTAPSDLFFFSYPPSILPFLVPFGALPYVPAAIAWTIVNLALLAWATRQITTDKRPVVAACLSPAAVMMVAYGHFGGAVAALAITAFTRASQRPALAGLCLALISVKPQLAVSIGVLLLLIGQWRAVAWSLPFAAAMIGLSIVLFGTTPWINFFRIIVPYLSWIIGDYILDHLRIMLSLYGAARLNGLSYGAAQAVQFAFALVVFVATARLVRRDGITPRTLALLLLAAIAALPYYLVYDLAFVAPALSVALFDPQRATARPFLNLVPAFLLWLVPAMAVVFGLYHWPVANVTVAGVLVLGLATELRFGRASNRFPRATSGDRGALAAPALAPAMIEPR